MRIYHLSMECYPVAKVGGLGDVVGALPKYQNKIPGIEARVIMPWYNRDYVHSHAFESVFEGWIHQNQKGYFFEVLKQKECTLGFELYLVRIPGLLDRENPYGYWDESQQFLAFQHAALHYLCESGEKVDVLHCHDYHTGLIPFMVEHCPEFEALRGVLTFGTIHNGEYQGQMHWEMLSYFPLVRDRSHLGLLDWDGKINPLASMIKCAHAFNAVSSGYMEELLSEFKGLEHLIRAEKSKAFGIINGIDTELWDSQTDPYLPYTFSKENALKGKAKNKAKICEEFGLNPELPLFGFIGRFAGEKGADFLPEIIVESIVKTYGALNIIVLGSGDKALEHSLAELNEKFSNLALGLGYNEGLSHQIYASCDFLLMPSRVEPCGLNQMYAMRYGTVPIVRYTGGLKDTVQDVSTGGAGLNFTYASAEACVDAMMRALSLYQDSRTMELLVYANMNFDFSWERSAHNYVTLYQKFEA
ncbi:glycogen synthase [Chryseobacterium sp. A321]